MFRRANFSTFIVISIVVFMILLPISLFILNLTESELYKDFQKYRRPSITGFPIAEEVLTITKNFEEPLLEAIVLENNVFTFINMNDCISLGEIGEPSLPVCPVYILIPQNKEISSVSVDYFTSKKINYDFLQSAVIPEQEEVPLSCGKPANFTINYSLYSSNTTLPSISYENKGTSFMAGFNILTINLKPITYIPGRGDMYYYTKGEITVKLKDGFGTASEQRNKFLRLKKTDIERVASLVSNPLIVNSYSKPKSFGTLDDLNGSCSCDPSKTYEYIIITNGSLLNSSGYNYSWYDLIEHRKNYSGLNGTIVTIQQINNCSDYWNNTYPFNDSVYSIREFIRDAYQNWETEYVLLGGNWRDSYSDRHIVPYRLFTDLYETDTYDTMPCDLYYSNLDGTWWYSNYSVWGGGKNSPANDKFSELYVGRITTYTPAHVSNAVSKIIWYDITSNNDEWLRTVTFAGDNLGWSVTSKQYMEELRIGNGSYSENIGFEEWISENPAYPFYTLENRYYHADGNWGKFTNSIKSDNSSTINHLGHSGWNTPFGLSQWSNRYNTKPFFGYSQGCLAGRYSYGYAGCEQLLCSYPERHSFAVVLNTGYGYGSSGSTYGASQHLHKIFWNYFFDEEENNSSNWQLGRAQAYSKDEFSSYIDSNRAKCYVWYSSHLFGDPAQRLIITNETKSNGDSCLSAEECDSGYCVDGVCCSSESCGICQACNISGSEGNCSNQVSGSDFHDDCSTSECGTGYCNGLGACNAYNDDLKHNCSICYYCSDSDVSCDLIPSEQDPNEECMQGNTSSDGCSGSYCDGSGSCQVLSSGDGGCPACSLCLDNDSECEYYPNNTQDDEGNLTCGICKKCDGLGNCIEQGVGQDLFDECDSNLECHKGTCDGSGECDVYSGGEKGSCGPCMYCIDDDSNCEYIPAEQDLFDECVGLQCDGDATTPYYWGWDSLTCYYASDVGAEDHYCKGDGSCYATEDLCSSQGKDGSTNITCERDDVQKGCNETIIGGCQNLTVSNNSAPTIPTLLSPSNGASNTDNSIDFDWENSIDADNDTISYYLAISSSLNSTWVFYNTSESSYSYSTIDAVKYYWKVKATDGQDNSSWSSEWYFTEETASTPKKSNGGGGSGGYISTQSVAPPKYSKTYELSEISEEEIEEAVIENANIKSALSKSGIDLSSSSVDKLTSNTKEVYNDVSVDIDVSNPDSKSTSLNFNFKYRKDKPSKKVVILIEVPKSFAESAGEISFESSVPYNKMEVIEDDPVYFFYYEELDSANISYSFYNNEYVPGSTITDNISRPWVFFEDEEEIIPECGNNLIEEGEECDGTEGLSEGFECSFECELVILKGCINDGNCTQKEKNIGNCDDCVIEYPSKINYDKSSIISLSGIVIVFVIVALIIGFKTEFKSKNRKIKNRKK